MPVRSSSGGSAPRSRCRHRRDGTVEDVQHDVVALPVRKLEELRRRVEAEEPKAMAKASRATAVARLLEVVRQLQCEDGEHLGG